MKDITLFKSTILRGVHTLVHTFASRIEETLFSPPKPIIKLESVSSSLSFVEKLREEYPRRNLEKMKIGQIKQVHKSKIIEISEKTQNLRKADGMTTGEENILLLIKTADCFPVLLSDNTGTAVGALHVGWRSAAGGILQKGINYLCKAYGKTSRNILAAIGPGIRKCCFEVKRDFIEYFEDRNRDVEDYLTVKQNRFYFDLPSFIKDRLKSAGVPPKSIDDLELCTCCEEGVLPSYRREGEKAKRMGGLIGIVPENLPDP